VFFTDEASFTTFPNVPRLCRARYYFEFQSAFHPPVPYVWKKYPNCQPMCHLHHVFAGTGHASLSIIEPDLLGPRLVRAKCDSLLKSLDPRPYSSRLHTTISSFLSNVVDQLHLLASGTRACLAGEVPEVRLGAQVLARACPKSRDFREKQDLVNFPGFFRPQNTTTYRHL